MRFFILLLLLSIITSFSNAQSPNQIKKEDSLLKIINTSINEKIQYNQYKLLARLFTGVNTNKENTYLNKALFIAEQTRDREFIVTSCLDYVDIQNTMIALAERNDNALRIADKGIAMGKEAQLNGLTALLLTKKGAIYRTKGNFTEAIKYNEEAENYSQLCNSDSIKIITTISFANTLIAKDENLAAFKKYMNALNTAEAIGNEKLQINLYRSIAAFYAKINQVEKAKDYYAKYINTSKKIKEAQFELDAYSNIAIFYANNKDFTTAREYLKKYNELAKTINDKNLIDNGALLEINILFEEDVKKAGAYLKENSKIIDDMEKLGYASDAYQGRAIMYSLNKNKDSAEFFYQKAKACFKPNESPYKIMNWNQSYASHLDRYNEILPAGKLMETNLAISESLGSLTYQRDYRTYLDSFYVKTNNKEKEVANKLALYKIRDSLDKQQKANEVLSIEIDSENKRMERENIVKEEKLTKKHNLQYMGITAGILSLFVLLATLGRLRVKPWFIKALGFFSFILLFEFIILLADKQIHHITHGDPLQILLIKIILIAVLLPLHHWLEHKAIHYILNNQKKRVNTT